LNRLSDIIHSLLVTYADAYLVYFDSLVPHFHALIQATSSVSDRQWALCVFDDVIQFTGAHSHRYTQFFLARMAESLADSSPEVSRRVRSATRSTTRTFLGSFRFDKRPPTGSASWE
jgi:importin-5